MTSKKKEPNSVLKRSRGSPPLDQAKAPHEIHQVILEASRGESDAATRLIHQLRSASYALRHMAQEALHHTADEQIWGYLLGWMASGTWVNALEHAQEFARQVPRIQDDEALYQSIAEVFAIDLNEREKQAKETALQRCLTYPIENEGFERCCHYAAACMKALRGEVQAISSLEHILQHGEKTWKLRAVQALSCLHEERSATALYLALVSYDRQIHQAASKALNEFGEKARQVWLMALSHHDSHIRWHGARGLGQIGDAQALDILAQGLKDENQAVRWATARVLASLDATAIPAILNVLCHYPINEPFRQAAYHALHAMPSRRTQEYLKPLLEALRSPAADIHAPRVAQRMALEWKNMHH